MSKFSYKVRVFPFNGTSKTKAFASLIIEDILEVKGFKIIEGTKGFFVGAPNHAVQKEGKTEYFDDVVFLDRDPETKEKSEFFKEIEAEMISEYQNKKNSNNRGKAATSNTNAPKSTKNRPAEPSLFDEEPIF